MAKNLSLNTIRARQRRKGAKEKAKVLRRYAKSFKQIDLRKNLTGKQLLKIERAFEEYTDLTTRAHKVFRPRDKKTLQAVQDFSQHSGDIKFDVAFVPTADINAKIRVTKKGKVIIRNKFVTQGFSAFNMRELATNPDKEITRAMALHPDAKSFIIKTGEFHYNGPMPAVKVREKLHEFMARYSPGGVGYERRGENSHYKNWMIGLETYNYANQDDLDEFMIERNRQRAVIQKGKKNERARYFRYFGTRVSPFRK